VNCCFIFCWLKKNTEFYNIEASTKLQEEQSMNTEVIINQPLPIEIIRSILLYLTRREQLLWCDTLSQTIHYLIHEDKLFKQTVFEYGYSKVVNINEFADLDIVAKQEKQKTFLPLRFFMKWAGLNGFERVIELAFIYESSVFNNNALIDTIIFSAAMNDHVHVFESVKKFVELEPNLEIFYEDYTLIQTAAYSNSINVFKLLVDNNVDWNKRELRYGQTPFHVACVRAHPEIVKYCLEELHVDVRDIDSDGFAALDLAAMSRNRINQIEVVKLLLNAGADKTNIANYTAERVLCPTVRQLLNLN
jgi:hypothetical protein